jgi:hypothetical protein
MVTNAQQNNNPNAPLISNAKRILANVVPRKAIIKNFFEDDTRLPGVQMTIMKKIDGE